MMPTTIALLAVFSAGFITMLATGLGPLALYWRWLRSANGQAIALALAALLMLAMSAWLIVEASENSWLVTALGFGIGALLTAALSTWSHRLENRQPEYSEKTVDNSGLPG